MADMQFRNSRPRLVQRDMSMSVASSSGAAARKLGSKTKALLDKFDQSRSRSVSRCQLGCWGQGIRLEEAPIFLLHASALPV